MLRSTFLAGSASLALAGVAPSVSAPLPAWTPGTLDLHHLATGRGNSMLAIFPDSTTMLVDAGDANSPPETMTPARPDASRRAGEWIARYIARAVAPTGRRRVDIAFMTHLHGDHVGDVRGDASSAAFEATGISDVANRVPIGTLVDRGFPSYDVPQLNAPTDKHGRNYIAFAHAFAARGGTVQRVKPGSLAQLGARYRPRPDFAVRALAVDGNVWSNGEVISTFPLAAGDPATRPTENMSCGAFRITYGAFAYYAGGDLTADTNGARDPWRDIEGTVAESCGRVDVASANHHGYHDACGPRFVRALRPRVVVIQAWSVTHPAISTLDTLTNPRIDDGKRDIYLTNSSVANRLINDRFAASIASFDGHVVVRVDPGGASYRVFVVDNRDESGTVVRVAGPFVSGATG